jgi:hypothetical protein
MAGTYWPERGVVLALWWGLDHWLDHLLLTLLPGGEMSPAQQRGLALWASLLSALVCLLFLPVPRWGRGSFCWSRWPDHRDLAHRQSSYRT